MKHANLIIETLASGIPAGGITVTKKGEIILQGIIVAQVLKGTEGTRGAERALPYKHEQYVLPATAKWLHDVQDQVGKGTHFGLWVDEQGTIWLDLVNVFPLGDISPAVIAATEREQKALQVLDIHNGVNKTLFL